MRSYHLVLCLTILALLCTGQGPAAEHPPVGFRGDGSGVFPEDCTPVTEWNWTERKNIAWVKDFGITANVGNNSSPIVAGGKVFCVTEPTPESLGPILYCLDPADGAILWQADCHHVDLLPASVQQEVAAALKAYHAFNPKYDKISHDYRRAMKGLPNPEAVAALAAAKAAGEELGLVNIPGTTAEGEIDGRARSIEGSWHGGAYEPPPIKAAKKALKDVGYFWRVDPWIQSGLGAIGYAPCTPCSDGERVYVATAFYDIFCYDMDGNLVWKVYVPHDELNKGGNFRASFFPSPMLYGDLLIRYWANDSVVENGMSVRAYDKRTGREVWRAGKGGVSPYALGTPLRMEIDGVRLLYLSDGRVLRLEDGKQVADGMGFAAHGSPDAVHGNLVFASCGQEGGGYGGEKARDLPSGTVLGYRLSWTSDAHEVLEVEELWRGDYSRRPLYYQDRLFALGKEFHVIDPQTGEAAFSRGRQYVPALKTNFTMRSEHYMTIAGGHIFLSQRGVHSVVSLPKGDFVSMVTDIPQVRGNGYMKKGKYLTRPQYGGHMFHSGNRSFYLQNMYHPKLVCIGDPSQPARMSKAHQ